MGLCTNGIARQSAGPVGHAALCRALPLLQRACNIPLQAVGRPIAMNDGQTSGEIPLSGAAAADRLDSWKRIAVYLKRDVTTVQRWERREAMPVHRHRHDKQGTVYAYRFELDGWWASRGTRLAAREESGIPVGLVNDPPTTALLPLARAA